MVFEFGNTKDILKPNKVITHKINFKDRCDNYANPPGLYRYYRGESFDRTLEDIFVVKTENNAVFTIYKDRCKIYHETAMEGGDWEYLGEIKGVSFNVL